MHSLLQRGSLFVAGLIFAVTVVLRITPSLSYVDESSAACLAFALATLIVSLVYVGMTYTQQAVLQRLQVILYMPVRQVVLRRFFWVAYLPAITVCVVIVLAVLWGLFGASSYFPDALIAGASALVVSIVFHTMLRITDTVLLPAARAISSVVAVGMAFAAWWVMEGRAGLSGAYITAGLALIMTAISLRLFRAPLITVQGRAVHIVKEYTALRFGSSMYVRALRNVRYRGTNIFLMVLLSGLCVLVQVRPILPFDAVCALMLFLTGTLGQEARSLSSVRYPVEMVLYGRLGMWLRSIWGLAFINAAFFTDLLLLIAIVWFPNGVGIEYMQVASIGWGLVGAGLLTASLVAPRRDDVLTQLLSMVVYGALTWVVFHNSAGRHPVSTLAIMAGCIVCLAFSYWSERIRWALTTRGRNVIHVR
jgi:hypothetical protein